MTLLEQMKADARACNARHRRLFGIPDAGNQTGTNGKSQKRIEERRRAVSDMRAQNMKIAEIARVLRVKAGTVKYDLYAIRQGVQ